MPVYVSGLFRRFPRSSRLCYTGVLLYIHLHVFAHCSTAAMQVLNAILYRPMPTMPAEYQLHYFRAFYYPSRTIDFQFSTVMQLSLLTI